MLEEVSELESVKPVMEELKDKWVDSLRSGNTGVGFTYETLLGIEENNISGSDIGGCVELKTKLVNSSCKITAFCLSPIWEYPLRARTVLEEYGYQCDKDPNRTNLYVPMKLGRNESKTGRWVFDVSIEDVEEARSLAIRDKQGKLIASTPLSVIRFKFRQKYNNLLLVRAEKRTKNRKVQYKYSEASLCRGVSIRKVEELLVAGKLVTEFRMKLDRSTGKFKDHGTCFRANESSTLDLFDQVETIF